MAYQNLSNPVYIPGPAAETGGIKVFSDMVHSYLDLVQRNAFPPAFLGELLNDSRSITRNYKDVLMYEVGYLVALAIGLLFIILVTLVALFFPFCRCCGNCGGKMYQKQTKRMTCKRRFLYFFLLIITLIILAGDICAFYSNSKIDTAVKDAFPTFNNTVGNLKTYVSAVPQDVDAITNSSSVPINQANSSVIGIGPILGGMIKSDIEQKANPTLTTVQNMVNDLNNTAKALVKVNDTFNIVHDQQNQLVQNLSIVQSDISTTKNSCGGNCDGVPPPSNLVIDANFSSIPDFSGQLKTINDFLNSGIEGTILNARQTINDIPQTVANQTKSSVQDVQSQLVKIKQKIADARSKIPIVDTLNSINSVLDQAANFTGKNKGDILKYEYYRWIVGLCLSSIILLVVVCNLFGLLLGPCGHRANKDPTERSCASNSGGDFFMAGAGFSFLFAWLLMLVTAILFAVGGNAYTSFCKPWTNKQLYKVVDDSVNITKLLNISDVNLSIANIYSDCENNTSLWTTLDLGSKVNLDEILNISQYTSSVDSTLKNTNINVNNITFMDSNQKNMVSNVANSGINTLDFDNIKQQMTKGITKTNLTAYAIRLDNVANGLPAGDTKTNLTNQAKALRAIQASIDANLLPQVKSLNTSIINLQALTTNLPNSLNAALIAINATQNYVDTQVVSIVKNETLAYLNGILGYFEAYISWTKNMFSDIHSPATQYRPGRGLDLSLLDPFTFIYHPFTGQ
ncbi:prominin-1-like [Lithobates pipiens]